MTKSKNARGGVELECHGICVCLVLSWELLYGRWISSRATVCPETKPIKTAVGIDRKTSPIVQFVSAGQTDSAVVLQPDVNEAFQSERSGTCGMLWFSYSPRGPLCLSSLAGLEPLGEGALVILRTQSFAQCMWVQKLRTTGIWEHF